jgi:aspartyl-tRNA(Asn)/glutamyl-tRNA(Gln) amidotransferase subunit A
MADPDLRYKPASELGRMIRGRQVSSTELTRMYLDALDSEGRRLNCLAELAPERALAEAARADAEVAAGTVRGPLHGVPYGVKDLLATDGIPTRWGSPAHADQVFDYDAAVVDRLGAAGCVLLGKLSMIELAGGGGYNTCGASIDGPCLNPYDTSRWAGGSSSGPGAATAAGLVGFSIGTETWGSILVPSSFCNLSGMRPTYGRVPRHGAMALSWTMDKIGPMCRSAEDCGLVLQTIAGHDPRDPSSLPGGWRFVPEAPATDRLRIGVLPTDFGDAETVKGHFERAVAELRAMGHTLGEAALPNYPYATANMTLIHADGAAAFEKLITSGEVRKLVDPQQQAGLIAGLAVPAVDYIKAMQLRSVAGPHAVRVFETFDILVAPTLLKGAIPAARPMSETWDGMGGNGGPNNLLGWPSLTVPMGSDDEGLPVGLELVGPPGGETALLALGVQFQRVTDWHRRRP